MAAVGSFSVFLLFPVFTLSPEDFLSFLALSFLAKKSSSGSVDMVLVARNAAKKREKGVIVLLPADETRLTRD